MRILSGTKCSSCHPERNEVESKDLQNRMYKKKDMSEEFDYKKAVEELEAIATKVEDPNTGIGDIDGYMKRSKELLDMCRSYLRGQRDLLEG